MIPNAPRGTASSDRRRTVRTDASRDPDVLVSLHVIDEARERRCAAGATDDATVQADRLHPGCVKASRIAFGIERVQRVAQVREELLAAVEPLRSHEAHVVRVEGVRHDQMRLQSFGCRDDGPVRKVVGIAVGVVDEPAVLDDERARARAVAARVPAGRRGAGETHDRLDGARHVLAFDVFVDILVADPAQAVACHLMAGCNAGIHDGRVPRQRHRDTEDRQRNGA